MTTVASKTKQEHGSDNNNVNTYEVSQDVNFSMSKQQGEMLVKLRKEKQTRKARVTKLKH